MAQSVGHLLEGVGLWVPSPINYNHHPSSPGARSSFLCASYSWAWGLAWGVVINPAFLCWRKQCFCCCYGLVSFCVLFFEREREPVPVCSVCHHTWLCVFNYLDYIYLFNYLDYLFNLLNYSIFRSSSFTSPIPSCILPRLPTYPTSCSLSLAIEH